MAVPGRTSLEAESSETQQLLTFYLNASSSIQDREFLKVQINLGLPVESNERSSLPW